MHEMLDIKNSRSRSVMNPISLELWIQERWQDLDISAGRSECILKNCQDSGIVLTVPTRMTAGLWWKDENVAVGAIIVLSTLLDPRSQLLQEEPHVND